jgi:hypothetical protein
MMAQQQWVTLPIVIVVKMRTPIGKARNLGPESEAAFARAGIHSLEHLQELGWEEACLRMVEARPDFLNLNAWVSVIGAIADVDWRRVDPADKERARQRIAALKRGADAAINAKGKPPAQTARQYR